MAKLKRKDLTIYLHSEYALRIAQVLPQNLISMFVKMTQLWQYVFFGQIGLEAILNWAEFIR